MMTPQEITAAREQIVAEARSWIGTPYHVGGMVKGAGCCCGSLILAVFQACGRMPDEKFDFYSKDCWAHWTEEKYQLRLMRHAAKIAECLARSGAQMQSQAKPGCIVLVRIRGNRTFNHAGIVTRWPLVVQSVPPQVQEVDATRDPNWSMRPIAIFDPFANEGG